METRISCTRNVLSKFFMLSTVLRLLKQWEQKHISSRLGLIKRMFVKFCCKYTCPKVLFSSPGGHNRTFGNLLLVGSGLNLNILSGARPVLAKFIPSSRIPGRVPKESGVSLFFFLTLGSRGESNNLFVHDFLYPLPSWIVSLPMFVDHLTSWNYKVRTLAGSVPSRTAPHTGVLSCLKPWQWWIILRFVFLRLSALKNAFFLALHLPVLLHEEANASMTDGLCCRP